MLDNQLQETFIQYAKQANNLYTLAYMLGYRPKVTSAATVDLDVFQVVPSTIAGGFYVPDFNYAMVIQPGMQVKSNSNNSSFFYIPDKIDFTTSSSYDPTTVTVYTTSGVNPSQFLLTKKAKAISGEIKTATFTFGAAQRFSTITINDTNIITITDVTDSNGNKWYEVPYLAQASMLMPITNPNYQSDGVPYLVDYKRVPRRYVSRFLSDNTLQLEFGAGVSNKSDSTILPNPDTIGLGLVPGVSNLYNNFNQASVFFTQEYGLAPSNNITVRYLVGGGITSNVASNTITTIISSNASFPSGVTGPLADSILNSLAVTNPIPSSGGRNGDQKIGRAHV